MTASVTVRCSCCEASCEDCDYEDEALGCVSPVGGNPVVAFSKTMSAGSSCNNKGFAEDKICYECVDCVYDDAGWTPQPDEVCEGEEFFEQTHSSGYAPQCQNCTPGSNPDGSAPCPTIYRDSPDPGTCEECCFPINVYKCGGLSRNRINGVVSYPCIGCGYVFQGQITAASGEGSSVPIVCGVGNDGNSREGVAVDAKGTVLTYRNSRTQYLTITYKNCLDGVFDPTINPVTGVKEWCGY